MNFFFAFVMFSIKIKEKWLLSFTIRESKFLLTYLNIWKNNLMMRQ